MSVNFLDQWFPRIIVEVSFQTPPAANPIWEDVSSEVMGWKTRVGRQSELDRVQAGTAEVILANQDRRFDPFNTAGPYAPGVQPGRRIRIRASWLGTIYPIFAGYVESWPQTTTGYDNTTARVRCSDGFRILSQAKIMGALPQERSDERINRILNMVGWSTGQGWILGDPVYGVLGVTTIPGPVGARSIGRGDTIVSAENLTSPTSALAHMQDVAAAENGLLFMGPDGEVVFQGRRRSVQYPFNVSQATFGDRPDINTGELPIVSVLTDSSDAQLWNEVAVQRDGGAVQIATDQPSVDENFKRTLSRSGLPLLDDTEALRAANWMLSRYKRATPRLSRLQLDGVGDSERGPIWEHILPRWIGDRITVRNRPTGAFADLYEWPLGEIQLGEAEQHVRFPIEQYIEQQTIIDQIEHVQTVSEREYTWKTTFGMSPAETRTFWILGDPVAGVLGVTTVPVY